MPHLRQVGQGHSAECGFFAAYALKVVHDHPGNVTGWNMDEAVIRQLRLEYLQSAGQPTGQYFVHLNQIIGYLTHIHAGAYSARPNLGGRGGRSAQHFVQFIDSLLAPEYGVILLFEGGGYRHYLDILPGAGSGQWNFYDPAPHTVPHFNAVSSVSFAEFELARGCPIYEYVTNVVAAVRP
jgi:hypothetical protein